MTSSLIAVLCTALVLCVVGEVQYETAEHTQIVDSVKVVIVSKQDDEGKWVNEVKLVHGTEQAPWKVEVEQKTLDRGGQQSLELTATLTGPKPAPAKIDAPRGIAGRILYPNLGQLLATKPLTNPESVRVQSPSTGQAKEMEVELRSSWRGSQYTLHATLLDWETANYSCANAGSYLAIINSEEEASFLADMLNLLPGEYRGAFVGITDEGQEGNWVTNEGVPIASAGFARWITSDQPDNSNGTESCGAFFAFPRGLKDVPCTGYFLKFICEKNNEDAEIKEPLGTSNRFLRSEDIDWVTTEDTNDYYDILASEEHEENYDDELESVFKQFPGFSSFYKVHTRQMDWETANKTCIEEGAYLAVINSEEEAMMLAQLLNKFYGDSHRGAFVGITDEAEEGTWLTIFGETTAEAGFARWFREDQPDNANGNENCGAIFPGNGGFNDVPCTSYIMHSICEKDDDTESAVVRSLEIDFLALLTTLESEETESVTDPSAFKESQEIFTDIETTTEQSDDTTKNYPTALGYVQYSNLNYFKLHLDVDKNWLEAQSKCEEEGGALAEIESFSEFRFLLHLLVTSPSAGSSLVFTGFGHMNGSPFAGDFEDIYNDEDICEAINANQNSVEIVLCQERLPFICKIKQVGKNTAELETSEETDNTVELTSSFYSSYDSAKGRMIVPFPNAEDISPRK